MNQSRMGLARQFCWMMAPVLLLSGMAFANAPAPRRPEPPPPPPPELPKPPEGPTMKIEQVPGLERAKLIIPKKLLPGTKEEKADAGMSPARTAIAGIAISGAVALLGLQFIRRRSGTPGRSSTLMLVAGGVGLALVSAAAMADIAIPGQPRRPRPVPPEPPVVLPAGVPVTISVVDTGDEVILQIAPEHVAPTPKPLPGLNAPHVEPGQKPAPSGLTPPPPPG